MSEQEVDANLLLRLLLDDHAEQSASVAAYLSRGPGERPSLALAPNTLSEVVFVLAGPRLKIPRDEIVLALDAILHLPLTIRDRDVVQRARDLYSGGRHGWSDCLIAAYAIQRGDGEVLSFDRGFDRIPGINRMEPPPARGLQR